MKVSDFKLLSTLPEEYDYELFIQDDGRSMVIGRKNQTIIGFFIDDDKLIPILKINTRQMKEK